MQFRPDQLRGAAPGAAGSIDFRLAKRHVVNEIRRGRLSRLDVCDAHPELLRNAEHCGRAAPEPCPVCEEPTLVLVTYLFGARLPAHGRCVTSAGEMAKLAGANDDLAVYVVEVCGACRWNHVARTFRVGRAHRASSRS